LAIPKPAGARAFEVLGLPLPGAGFYVVELESARLGAALLDKPAPMYVPAAALVTNLAAHFKHGRESSLVWVTTLDQAAPVPEAEVAVRDCNGQLLWQGQTDSEGLARIAVPLASPRQSCSVLRGGGEWFVSARKGGDMTFVLSGWEDGIEGWRFHLPEVEQFRPLIAHTVLDRSLLRAGETVHMKHFLRKHTTTGLTLVAAGERPEKLVLRHGGGEQEYTLPLTWDEGAGIAESDWPIPREAKLGLYRIFLTGTAGELQGGDFRVEAFRVPLMKGAIDPPREPLIQASEVTLDLHLAYLAGGGASQAPITLRAELQPKTVRFPGYDDYVFGNGEVPGESRQQSGDQEEECEEEECAGAEAEAEDGAPQVVPLPSARLTLDQGGALRTSRPLPKIKVPYDLMAEMEFQDPNGEIQTVAARIPLWPAAHLVGIRPEGWASSAKTVKFHVAVLDVAGEPVAGTPVQVEFLQRKRYSHRKRLVGGFYAYEHVTEVERLGMACTGTTDARGLLACEAASPATGEVLLQAAIQDPAGRVSQAHRSVWVVGERAWFDVADHDRIDLLPEQRRYEPGEVAKLQVRMPFAEATVLVTVEREGIVDAFVRRLSGEAPLIELPIAAHYAPNVYVSALCLRGRVGEVQPTALVDLGKPAFKLGLAALDVGWRGHELRVEVNADKPVYRVRDQAAVSVQVSRADSAPLPPGAEVAIAAVDEGLLELLPNRSWELLKGMMGRRAYEVETATAQMQVVGKRHYGRKALPAGGGGGRQATRELFDTLLLWRARVALDGQGRATLPVPLNDALTSFRIVAVAHAGADLFGNGETRIRTSQDLMLYAGLPPLVRAGDRFQAGITVRNASDQPMDVAITARLQPGGKEPAAAGAVPGETAVPPLPPLRRTLAAGEAQELGWAVEVPGDVTALAWEIDAAASVWRSK
jgi:hypothetical protein